LQKCNTLIVKRFHADLQVSEDVEKIAKKILPSIHGKIVVVLHKDIVIQHKLFIKGNFIPLDQFPLF